MRLFIGIPLSEDLSEHLKKAWHESADLPGKYRPTSPENWHLTLAFLDEVPEDKVETLAELIAQSMEKPPRGEFLIDGFETFPAKRPTHVTARVVPEHPETWNAFIVQLRDFISLAAPSIDRKPWTAHISIGRAEKGMALPTWRKEIEPFRWKPNEFYLIKSTLTAKGSVYEHLYSYPLDL